MGVRDPDFNGSRTPSWGVRAGDRADFGPSQVRIYRPTRDPCRRVWQMAGTGLGFGTSSRLPSRMISLHFPFSAPFRGGFSSATFEGIVVEEMDADGEPACRPPESRQPAEACLDRHNGMDTPPTRHRSSVVEHTLGKGEVTGSSPVGGFGTSREAQPTACVRPKLDGQAPESPTVMQMTRLRFVVSPIGHCLNPTAGISEKPADG